MGFPLGPTLANALLVYHKKNWLEHCPLEYKPFYYHIFGDIYHQRYDSKMVYIRVDNVPASSFCDRLKGH